MAAPPELEFVSPHQLRHPLGRGVFVGRLPSLRLLNWTADCSEKYWLWMSDIAGERRLNTMPDGGLQEIHVSCPNQGSIWIEPKKNYARDASSIQRLTYTVLPEGIDLHVVEPCSTLAEPAHLQVRLPHGWVFQPMSSLQKDDSGLWTIPGGGEDCGGEPIFRCIQIPSFTACLSRSDPLSCTSRQRESCLAGRRVGGPAGSYRRLSECSMPYFTRK
jgi:hypothetical protein